MTNGESKEVRDIEMFEEADKGECGLILVVKIPIPQMTTVKDFRAEIAKRINTPSCSECEDDGIMLEQERTKKVVKEMTKETAWIDTDLSEETIESQKAGYHYALNEILKRLEVGK